MKSISGIKREFKQKIDNLKPDELGLYLIETEFSIANRFASGEWTDEEATKELKKINQEAHDASDRFSLSQYIRFRETYHYQAETELFLSHLKNLIKCYDVIEHLLKKCIEYRRTMSDKTDDDLVIHLYLEMLSGYQKAREEIISSEIWIKNLPPITEKSHF